MTCCLRSLTILSSAKTLCLKVYDPGTDTTCDMNTENNVYMELVFVYALPEFVANTADSPRVLCYSMESVMQAYSSSAE